MKAGWLIVAVAAVAHVVDAAPIAAPVARYAPKGIPGQGRDAFAAGSVRYLYAAYYQLVDDHSAGAGATLMQGDPALGVDDFHSLAEIAVESVGAQQIVELGWTVDRLVNGDVEPHVFAFHWVDGKPTCYNGCGWVQVSANKQPGMRVTPGESHRYEIKRVAGDWWLFYDGEAMGYYPQSLWPTPFKQAGLVQWFGEVAATAISPCTQMGNGKLGSDADAASFADVHVFDPDGATVGADGVIGGITQPLLYTVGRVTPTRFGFGGPGASSGCCTPSTCSELHAECGSLADPKCMANTLVCGACAGAEVCTADHECPSEIGPRDGGWAFDAPPALPVDSALDGPGDARGAADAGDGGGCCDAGAGGSGSLVLAVVVALALGRRRPAPR